MPYSVKRTKVAVIGLGLCMMKTGENIAGLNSLMRDGNHLEAQYQELKIVQVNAHWIIIKQIMKS